VSTSGEGEGEAREHAGSPQVDRAERIVDDLLQRAARWGRRTAALVREEAEDVWAEAKELRQSQHKD
jgi:hypothetical protein